MKKNKRRSIVLIIITISVFLIAIIGATYAFFATTRDLNGVINANVQTAASMYSFTATSNRNIEMNITYADMSQDNISTENIKTGNGTIDVSLASPSDNILTVCTYDIVWVWDSSDKYTMPDAVLPYEYIPNSFSEEQIEEIWGSKEEYEKIRQWFIEEYGQVAWDEDVKNTIVMNSWEEYYPHEFSIMVNNKNEMDLSNLPIDTDGKTVTLQKGAGISSTSTIASTKSYDISAQIYNLPVDQKNLFGKSFKAHITVNNLDCYMTDISSGPTLVSYITENLYEEDGVNGLYYHDGQGTYPNADLEIGDNSYRYTGQFNYPKAAEGYNTLESIINPSGYTCQGICYKLTYDSVDTEYSYLAAINKAIEDGYIEDAVNNFVCFEEDADEDGKCTDDNLYRIIGVINDKVKLIKYAHLNTDETLVWNELPEDYDDSYAINIWENSTLEKYLNSNEEKYYYNCINDNGNIVTCQKEGYLHSLRNKVKLIDETIWSVGGIDYDTLQNQNVKVLYDMELNNWITYNAKIGLMYISDYGYAALPEYWPNELPYYESSYGNDWMFPLSEVSWTISRISDAGGNVAFISGYDGVVGYDSSTGNNAGVHPTFYLKYSVKVLNANAEKVGSKNVPMIIG